MPASILSSAAERAALVAGDEGRDALTRPAVALVLLDEFAGDGLDTGHQHRPDPARYRSARS